MEWNNKDHSFCESKLLGIPEYLNSISSILISCFGWYGLFYTPNADIFIDTINSLIIILGIGSVGYHWTGNIGWGLMDEFPMILGVTIGTLYVDYIYRILNPYFTIYFKLEVLFYLAGVVLFLVVNGMSKYRYSFPENFGLLASILLYKIIRLLGIIKIDKRKEIIGKIIFSVFTIISSVIIWSFTEKLCDYFNSYILLIGHPLWHLSIGFGFYNLIQCIYFIKLDNEYPDFYKLTYNKYLIFNLIPSININA